VALRRLVGWVGLGPRPDAKDVEIAVLRHQLTVVHRHVSRPPDTPGDRLVLACLAKVLPRERWSAFLLSPSRFALAPGSGDPPVALPHPGQQWLAWPGSGGGRPRGPSGAGEPPMGLRADRGGPHARHHGVGDVGTRGHPARAAGLEARQLSTGTLHRLPSLKFKARRAVQPRPREELPDCRAVP